MTTLADSDLDSTDPPARTRHPVPPPYLDARDHLAAAALTGLLAAQAGREVVGQPAAGEMARGAYLLADEMLTAREGR